MYEENFFLGNLYGSNFRKLFLDFKEKNYNTNFIQNRELIKKTRVWPTLLISNSGPNAVNAELSKT